MINEHLKLFYLYKKNGIIIIPKCKLTLSYILKYTEYEEFIEYELKNKFFSESVFNLTINYNITESLFDILLNYYYIDYLLMIYLINYKKINLIKKVYLFIKDKNKLEVLHRNNLVYCINEKNLEMLKVIYELFNLKDNNILLDALYFSNIPICKYIIDKRYILDKYFENKIDCENYTELKHLIEFR